MKGKSERLAETRKGTHPLAGLSREKEGLREMKRKKERKVRRSVGGVKTRGKKQEETKTYLGKVLCLVVREEAGRWMGSIQGIAVG